MSVATEALERMARSEPLSRPVLMSAAAHVALFTVIAFWSFFNAPIRLGDPTGSEGGAVTVNVVQGIPLPASRPTKNPVANPVEHEVPAPNEPPKPAEVKPPEPAPNAVEIPSEKKKPEAKKPSPPTKVQKSAPEGGENQLRSSTGAAVSSPIFTGQQSGTGGVGFGNGSPFGSRFGWYATALQRRVSEEWRNTLGQVQGGGAQPAIVVFRINRNGAIDDIQVEQSSGNSSLDFSARRAVTNISPFQPLPADLGRSAINVEMWFELK